MSKRILITGGTGSLGVNLVEFFTGKDWDVSVLSRDGQKQEDLRKKYPMVHFYLSDICAYDKVFEAVDGNDYVVHAAAQKVVSAGERSTEEFIRTNIVGSETVARACNNAHVPIALLVSSDKACSPLNLYGRTKAVAEDIFNNYGYSALRYGNVISSRGSFLNHWKDLVSRGEQITIRYPYPTRFILPMQRAVSLVDDALKLSVRDGEIFIPHSLKAFSVHDVAKLISSDREILQEKLLPGEKRHEILLADGEQGDVVSNFLCEIRKGYGGTLRQSDFSSNTAQRLKPLEVLKEFNMEVE